MSNLDTLEAEYAELVAASAEDSVTEEQRRKKREALRKARAVMHREREIQRRRSPVPRVNVLTPAAYFMRSLYYRRHRDCPEFPDCRGIRCGYRK